MSAIHRLHTIQKKKGLTNYEMAMIMGISEKCYEHWLSVRRTPRGPSRTLITWTVQILEKGSITKDELLKKTGRNFYADHRLNCQI